MLQNARVLYRLDKIEDMKRLCKDALKRSSHTRNASYLRCRALYVLAGAYRKQKKNHKSEYCAQLALQVIKNLLNCVLMSNLYNFKQLITFNPISRDRSIAIADYIYYQVCFSCFCRNPSFWREVKIQLRRDIT
jgi:hypothetical protein